MDLRDNRSPMRSRLRDPPFLNDDDAVAVFDRREPVRNHDRRPALHEVVQRDLHLALRFRIERRRRFVEDQYRRILEDRSGDGDALTLPSRQPRTPLANLRIESFGMARMKSRALAASAAFSIASREVPASAPYAMLAATVSLKSTISWLTRAIC